MSEFGSRADDPQLAVFQPVEARAPIDPFLACSLRQVVEIRDSEEILPVQDPSGETLGYIRWREQPIPVLNPERWGSRQRETSERRMRLVLVRGAKTPKVLAIPIQQFWIEPAEATAQLRASEARRRVWQTRCLALIHASFGEVLLLDVDGLFRSLVA